MKLNNKGFGAKDMIIYSCIIIFFLLLVDILIHSMYKSFEDDDTSSGGNTPSQEVVKVDKNYYHKKEIELKEATAKYLNDNEIDIDNTEIDISLLKAHNLISDIYDSDGIAVCGAYSVVIKSENGYDITPFVNCRDYSTEAN